MHTAICAFEDRQKAQQAVENLVRYGFSRQDVHIECKAVTTEADPLIARGQDSTPQQPVHDRGVLSSFGHFFASLLGEDNPSGQADTYSQHVERGNYVLVADCKDDAEAQRARSLLKELQGGEIDIVQRTGRPPLRDLVGMRDQKAGMVERSSATYEGASSELPDRERAMAANRVPATAGPALRDPDVTHAPGLRYADKDKPNG